MMFSQLFSFSCLNLNSRFRWQHRALLLSQHLDAFTLLAGFLPCVPLLSSLPKSREKRLKTWKTKYFQKLDNIVSEKYYRVGKSKQESDLSQVGHSMVNSTRFYHLISMRGMPEKDHSGKASLPQGGRRVAASPCQKTETDNSRVNFYWQGPYHSCNFFAHC